MRTALPHPADAEDRARRWREVQTSIGGLIADEDDEVAILATVACELHHAFEKFHWTGFYRAVSDDLLVVGPYQGGHGCLRIPFSRGVCGAAARTRATQDVPDVHAVADHIACSTTTRSEVVVPVITPTGRLVGVLDVDSDLPAAFDARDVAELEAVAAAVGRAVGS